MDSSEVWLHDQTCTDWAKLHPQAKALAAEIGLVVMFGDIPAEQLDLIVSRSRAYVVDLETVRMIGNANLGLKKNP